MVWYAMLHSGMLWSTSSPGCYAMLWDEIVWYSTLQHGNWYSIVYRTVYLLVSPDMAGFVLALALDREYLNQHYKHTCF